MFLIWANCLYQGVERIEITKGNQSCLYGLSSVGATINIIPQHQLIAAGKSHLRCWPEPINKQAFIFNPSIDIGYKTTGIGHFTAVVIITLPTVPMQPLIPITDRMHTNLINLTKDGFTKNRYVDWDIKKWNRLDLSVIQDKVTTTFSTG